MFPQAVGAESKKTILILPAVAFCPQEVNKIMANKKNRTLRFIIKYLIMECKLFFKPEILLYDKRLNILWVWQELPGIKFQLKEWN